MMDPSRRTDVTTRRLSWPAAGLERAVWAHLAAVDTAGRDVGLSAAVIAWGAAPTELGGFPATRSAQEALQDWLDFPAALAAEADALVVPGVGGWLNTPDAVLRQLGAAGEVADGVALYSYQQPTDHPDASSDLHGVRRFWYDLDQADWGWSG